jgi:hypothetical protein
MHAYARNVETSVLKWSLSLFRKFDGLPSFSSSVPRMQLRKHVSTPIVALMLAPLVFGMIIPSDGCSRGAVLTQANVAIPVGFDR